MIIPNLFSLLASPSFVGFILQKAIPKSFDANHIKPIDAINDLKLFKNFMDCSSYITLRLSNQ